MTILFYSFGAFGCPSKEVLFVLDAFKWAPTGFATWIINKGKSPGMVNLRENRKYSHQVATQLIGEKRQELRDCASRKDLLSLLGSSCIPFAEFDPWYNVQFFSQSKLLPAVRSAAERRRDHFSSSVRQLWLPLKGNPHTVA